MANCYVCPECGEYLDWSEAASHRCDVRTHEVVNNTLAPEPEVKAEPASAEFVSSFCAELRKKYAGEKR